MSENRLQIETDALQIELAGNADEIRKAYDALHDVLTEQLEATIEANDRDDTTAPGISDDASNRSDTAPMYQYDSAEIEVEEVQRDGLAEHRRRFIVCSEMCNRVAALTRSDFEASMFAEVLDYDRVHTFYVSREAADRLEGRIAFGQTLWRELTAEGHAAISGHGDLDAISDDGDSS